MADQMGANYDTVTSNTSISDGPYYAVQAIGGSVTVTLITYGGNNDPTITGWTIPDGGVMSYRIGWKKVEKTSGDGNLICYKNY